MIVFRNLNKNEIYVRAARKFNGKAELLIYADARSLMNLLDETFGPFGWSVQYKTEKDMIFCGIGIYDNKSNTWIWKWYNGSSDAAFETEKSTASEAFKRSCVMFGGSRELYSAPRIIVPCENEYETWTVKEIGYDENDKISDLQIVNSKNEIVFNYKNGRVQKIIDVDPIELLTSVCGELKNDGENYEELGKFFNYYKNKIVNFDSVSTKTIMTLWNKWNKK